MNPQDLAFFAVLALGLWLLLIRPQRCGRASPWAPAS
jgi:hypothetical protein